MTTYKDRVAKKNFELSKYLLIDPVSSAFIALLITLPLSVKYSGLSLDKNLAISCGVGLFTLLFFCSLPALVHKLIYDGQNREKSIPFNNPFSLLCYATAAGADLINNGVESLGRWKQNRRNSKEYFDHEQKRS